MVKDFAESMSVPTDRVSSGGDLALLRDRVPTAFLDRCLALVETVISSPTPLTLSQLARMNGLPKSTVHRLLRSLQGLQLIGRRGAHYVAGPRVSLLESAAELISPAICHVIRPPLVDLHQTTGLPTTFCCLRGDRSVVVESLFSSGQTALAAVRGTSRPAQVTASGLLLLAHQQDSVPGIAATVSPPSEMSGRLSVAQSAQVRAQISQMRNGSIMEVSMAVQAHGRTLGAVSLAFPAHSAVGQSWIRALRHACNCASAAASRLPPSVHRSSGMPVSLSPDPPN
ncbi:helix-turn-helix domain-containing protein [Streptomyces wedmorensis]|uniref:helix-turn-helix domain-containing protein n=1 Tax=Streptomyces wedmorensis TaxID=43759 RepID=UPI00379DC9CC